MERGCAPSAATATGVRPSMTATTLATSALTGASVDTSCDPFSSMMAQPRFCRSPLRSRRRRPGAAVSGPRRSPCRRSRTTFVASSAAKYVLRRSYNSGLALDTTYIFFGMAPRICTSPARHPRTRFRRVATITTARRPKPGAIAVQILLRQPAQVPRNRLALPPRTPASTIASRPARRTWATGSAAPMLSG